ncbi:MAG: tetratricopeptide repeat protein [Methanotrichaceae archaeon]
MPSLDVIAITAVGVGTGFLLHELAHKFVAQRYGYWAEYHADLRSLFFIILMAVAAGFFLAAPGGVYIRKDGSPMSYGDGSQEQMRSEYKREQLWISLAGPGINILLALLFFIVLISGFLQSNLAAFAAYYAFFINLSLAAFNMLPFGPLDGRKVFQSNRVVWAIVGVPTILLGLAMIFGVHTILFWLGAAIIGLIIILSGLMDDRQFKKHDEFTKRATIGQVTKEEWNGEGMDLFDSEKYAEAIKAYDMALAADPNYVNAWLNKGTAFFKLGKYHEAIEAFNQVIKMDPQHADAWHREGVVLKKMGRKVEADDAFAKAKELGYKS